MPTHAGLSRERIYRSHQLSSRCFARFLPASFPRMLGLGVMALFAASAQLHVAAQTITNLSEITRELDSHQQIIRDVDLDVTVCAASRAKVGVLIVRDETDVELLQLGGFEREIRAGERLRISRKACLMRKREMGVQLSAASVIDLDGLHSRKSGIAEVELRAGKIPLRLDWFNYWRQMALDLLSARSPGAPQPINPSNLWHAVVSDSGETNFAPGLQAEYYEGSWEYVPDFNLLKPVKTVVVTNVTLSIRSRNDRIGIRYSGFLTVPRDGKYRFQVWSDDGAMLFLGDPNVALSSLGSTTVPAPKAVRALGGGSTNANERCWITVEGRVSFVSAIGEGVSFDLSSEQQVISVKLADAAGLDLSALPNARVRVTGLGRGAMALDSDRRLPPLTPDQSPSFPGLPL